MYILRYRLTAFTEVEDQYNTCEYRGSSRLLEAAKDLGRTWDEIREQNVVLDDVFSPAQKGEIATLMEMVNHEQRKFAFMEDTVMMKIREYKSRGQC